MDASFGYSSIAHSQPSHYAQPYFTQVTQQSFNILQCPRVFPNFDSREQKDFLLVDEQGTATNTIVLHHDLTKEFLQTSNGMPLQQDSLDVDTKTLFVEDVDTKPFMAGQIQVVPQPGGQLTTTHLQGPVIQVQLVSQQHMDTNGLIDGQDDEVVSPKMKKEKRKGDPKAGEYLLTKEDIDKLNSRKLSAAPTVSKMKKFTCDSCGRSLMTKQALDIHMRSHTGEKPYTCDDCGKTFVQQATLNRHRKGVHMPKSQECFECGKLFGYRDYLVKHMRTHTGERPYQCSKCEKTFRDKTSLNQHSRSHKD